MAPAYDVALSYAGEDREVALALAARLQAAGYRVFFDRFEELWGADLSVRLHEVYAHQCRYAVVFVSQHYLRKPWTQHERRVLMSRAIQQPEPFLLPLRLDDSELPGLPGAVAFKDARQETPDSLCTALQRLIGPPLQRPVPAPLTLRPSDFLYAVVHADDPLALRFNLGLHLANPGAAPVALQRLEATLTPPGQCGLQLMWTWFYDLSGGGRFMQGGRPPQALTLAAGQSCLQGMQFRGPKLAPPWLWPEGRHELELLGWVHVAPRSAQPDLRWRCGVDLQASDAARLQPWMQIQPGMGAAADAVAVPLALLPAE